MVKLNTEQSIREHNRQVYEFNRYINHNNRLSGRKWRRHPLNMNLTGFEAWFKLWLSAMHNIKDNNLHLENLQTNFNRKNLYFERAKGRQTIFNR